MRVWITGARGFIGRNLARYLGPLGYDVAGIGHGSWLESQRDDWAVSDWLNGEISQSNLDVLARRHGAPDAIFHLAGGSSVGPSFSMPLEDMGRSVGSAGELLEWVRLRAPSASVIMASSAAVYGGGHAAPIREFTDSSPYSPYGYHKRMAELMMESYALNFGLRVAIVRLFSVYGIGLRKQLLWDACTRLKREVKTIEFGGSGDELRDWLHVEDAARILWLAMENASSNCLLLNGGTGVATPVSAITKKLCEEWGSGVESRFSGDSREGDPVALVANTDKLNELGFEVAHEWQQGLKEYVAWFKGQQ